MRRLLTCVVVAHLGMSGVGPVHAQNPEDDMEGSKLRVHETSGGELAYRLHLPNRGTPDALVVMMHGCLQDAADIAAGTRMDDRADEYGFAVLYPQQSAERNPQLCWNWFAAGPGGAREVEIGMLSSLVREVAEDLAIASERTHLVGMSAGGAMAAYLAVADPDLFESVVMHSAIPWGAASTMVEGLAAMQSGGPEETDVTDSALRSFLEAASPRRFLVVHGADDEVVRPVNAERAASRWVRLLDERARRASADPLVGPTAEAVPVGGEIVGTDVWSDPLGTTRVRMALIPGLAHAWSGGDPAGTYTDPSAPPVRDLIVAFLGLLD
jgi:poly(hydroxyalkanoate) depolymerase family esterase